MTTTAQTVPDHVLSILPTRIATRIAVDMFTGCWRWQGAIDADGYGNVWYNGRTWRTHRLIFTLLERPLQTWEVLDHLKDDRGPCRHRDCCNPAHLEPVTVAVNSKRVKPWNDAKTHCPSGHAYIEHGKFYTCKDGYVRRFCRECRRRRDITRTPLVRTIEA